MLLDQSGRGNWLNLALALGAVTAALAAVGIVVGLLWWVYSLPPPAPAPVAVPQPVAPLPHSDAPTAGAASIPKQPALPHADAQARAAAEIPLPVAPTPTVAEPGRPNSDVEKNRAIGAGLSRLGQDPEAARQFGLPP